jgi:DHA1 family inner membrane transport protein
MTGYTIAIVVAVPLMKWVAATVGWRWSYGAVTLASAMALGLVAIFVPSVQGDGGARWRKDLSHLRGRNVWAAIAFVSIGFGGFATVFAFMVPILEKVDLLSVTAVSAVLAVNGIAMTVATLVAGKVTDISPRLSAEIGTVAALVIFIALAAWGATPAVGIVTIVAMSAAAAFFSQGSQTHFMDVIHASPMLGAAMSHASLNLANGLGAAAGAVVIGAGFGYLSAAAVAIAFTVVSLGILAWGPGLRRARAS